jgi:hypothetical protein
MLTSQPKKPPSGNDELGLAALYAFEHSTHDSHKIHEIL